MTARLVDWLKMYKTSDGKPPNSLAQVRFVGALDSPVVDSPAVIYVAVALVFVLRRLLFSFCRDTCTC